MYLLLTVTLNVIGKTTSICNTTKSMSLYLDQPLYHLFYTKQDNHFCEMKKTKENQNENISTTAVLNQTF